MKRSFDGHHVSDAWFEVLTAARRAGVAFRLNSGRRTFAEQQRLHDLWRAGNGALAAVPSHTAPHIRTGRDDHALDVDMHVGGGVEGLRAWLRGHGLPTSLTVPGEGWHVEADSAAELRAASARLAQPPTLLGRLRARPLRPGGRGRPVRAVQVYLRRAGLWKGRPAKLIGTYGPALERAVRTFQERVGLAADGVVGPKTFAALRRRYGWRVWSRRGAAGVPAPSSAPAPAAQLHVSDAAIALIEAFEGFRPAPYDDPAGHATVGYGHLLHFGSVTAADAKGVWVRGQREPGRLTAAEARTLLRQELAADYEPAVRALALPLTQSQHDALVSFVFNVGTGAVGAQTGVGRALRERRWRDTAEELLRWDKAGSPLRQLAGLTHRRQAERALFLEGTR